MLGIRFARRHALTDIGNETTEKAAVVLHLETISQDADADTGETLEEGEADEEDIPRRYVCLSARTWRRGRGQEAERRGRYSQKVSVHEKTPTRTYDTRLAHQALEKA
jgi:hypothetical protein